MKKVEASIEIIPRAVITDKDKILLCVSNDQPPIYFLPGGHLNPGETLEAGFSINLGLFFKFLNLKSKN